MARSRTNTVPLSALEENQTADCFALLAEKSRNLTRDQKPYYLCRFRDAHRSAGAVIWGESHFFNDCEQNWVVGRAYKLRCDYRVNPKYGPQLELHKIREANAADQDEGFDPSALCERSRFEPTDQLADLHDLLEREIADEPLRRLTLLLLDRHGDHLISAPASERKYHPFVGGLIEHTSSVARTALFLVDHYREIYRDARPLLNRDLVLAGAALHGLGRVAEFDESPCPVPTIPGRLLGHIVLGRDLIRDAAREVPELNPELLLLLEHLVLSHLNLPEWGSPRLPLIPESLILFHAIDLDAKMEMYQRCLATDQAAGPFTDPDPVLKRTLLKQRTV